MLRGADVKIGALFLSKLDMNNKIKLTFPLALDLTTNQTTVDDTFSKAEDITGPFFNDAYSPFWIKTEDIDTKALIDKDGHKYQIKNSALTIDDKPLFNVTNKKLTRSEIKPDHELFYYEDGIEYYADFDSAAHTWDFNGQSESAALFIEGTVVHSRLKKTKNGLVLASLFIDDTGTYKVLIKTESLERILDVQWKQNVYTIVSNHPNPGFTTDTTQTMYNPIFFIGESNGYVIITLCSNQGQPFKTTDFSYSTWYIDNTNVYENQSFSTASVPVTQDITEEIIVTNEYSLSANTYSNNPCYAVTSNGPFYSEYPTSFTSVDWEDYVVKEGTVWTPTQPMFITYENEDNEVVRDQVGYIEEVAGGKNRVYSANIAQTFITDEPIEYFISNVTNDDILEFDDGYLPEYQTVVFPMSSTAWMQFAYVYTENTLTYKNSVNKGALAKNEITIDLSDTNLPNGQVEVLTGSGTITKTIKTNSASAITGNGITPSSWKVSITYNNGAEQSYDILQRNYNGSQSVQYYYTVTANATSGVNPVLVDDDGYLHGLFSAALDSRWTVNSYIAPFRAIITNIAVVNSTTVNIAYTSDEAFTFPATYQFYKGSSFAIGQNYYRQTTTYGQNTFSATANGHKALDIVYDSGANEVFYEPGVLQNNDQFYTSITQDPMPYSNVGTVVQLNDYYRLVYMNNLIVGLSYGEKGFIGTELAEWNSIDSTFYIIADNNDLYWKDNDGTYYKVTVEEGNEIQLLENRYVVINTTDYFNVYDIEDKKKKHYASDYVHRCFGGSLTYNTSLPQVYYKNNSLLSDSIYLVTTGINSNYLVTADGISSTSIGPVSYMRLVKGSETFISCKQPIDTDIMPIDLYYSTTGSYAQYSASYKVYPRSVVKYINSSLIGINYPVATGAYTLYAPNIFTEYLTTLANKDSVLNGKYAYQLVYANNTTPILLFSTATQMENIETIFVIQSQFYAVANHKLYALTYSNSTLVEMDAIIDVTGLQYLGSLPTIAYFYSPMNKSFYSFTGDANLTMLYEANKINTVYTTYYNTATQALYICTDRGVYVISSNAVYRIPIYGVKDVFFTSLGYSVIETEDRLTYLSYYKRDDFTPMDLYIETKLYGSPKVNMNIARWKITMIGNGHDSAGTIKLTSKTLTDKGAKSIQKELKVMPGDWDVITNSYQFDYAAPLERGQGVALAISSPWPVSNISAEITQDNSDIIPKKIV